ncbi:MAG: hypothetical protein H6838_18235 [Planctomycetes bacterium]|nr:hypothetical protein [Planctomycetota bacterium]
MEPTPEESRAEVAGGFLVASWCSWLLGPAQFIGWMFSSSPMPVMANAAALVLLLVACSRWRGWRATEFWLLLGYFCAFAACCAAYEVLSVVLEGQEQGATVWDVCVYSVLILHLGTLLSAFANPALVIVRVLRDHPDPSGRGRVVDAG